MTKEMRMEPLENAPPEIQLAVDLIYLLESSEISPDIALKALDIVKRDYLSKQAAEAACQNSN
ncbi:hypothetical protein PROVALCAL_02356 [Providencia alcalifaciens DSM 30120]|uniref:DUF2496 domain-containing protein n=3 Tax=Providencia alcalifaciens TaxID=126385 RepID=B6XGC5_9GAMM|nr:hypothetical protein PROVALCAL_02356 [Providencia alcalifaciens DSM 30120]